MAFMMLARMLFPGCFIFLSTIYYLFPSTVPNRVIGGGGQGEADGSSTNDIRKILRSLEPSPLSAVELIYGTKYIHLQPPLLMSAFGPTSFPLSANRGANILYGWSETATKTRKQNDILCVLSHKTRT